MPGYVAILTILLISLAAGVCLYWGFRIEVKRVQARKYHLSTPDLPDFWQDKKILCWSDLHVGDGLPLDRLDYFLGLIRAEQPDLLLFVGDLSESADFFSPEERQAYLQSLAQLKDLAPLGLYAVRGNHDIESQAAQDFFDQAMAAMGAQALVNQSLTLHGLQLIGLDDALYGQPDMATACADSQPDFAFTCAAAQASVSCQLGTLSPTKACQKGPQSPGKTQESPEAPSCPVTQVPLRAQLVLLHEPDPAGAYLQAGGFPVPTLFISGHSHRGQIRPFGLQLYRPCQAKHYNYGLYEFPQALGKLIVTAGLGTVGIPARFAAPPEYIVIQL